MNKKIAYCGLNCQTCDAYLATIHNDQKLKVATAKKWARLNQAPILPEHIHCEGCRMPGAKTIFCETICEIRKCAIKKEVSTCGGCSNLETCRTIESILKHNPSIIKNLKQ